MDNVIEKLKAIGLTSYEAKVYIALLKKYPATGYEVSQAADIPQSRAYDALKSLASDKIVIPTDDKPQKFTPIAPKELTSRYKRKVNSTIEYLDKKLPQVKEEYNEPIHTVSGYETILSKAKEIIKNTKRSLYVELWSNDFKHLEKELREAYDNEVDIKIVGFNELKSPFGDIYEHSGGKEIENTIGRMIFLLSDAYECLFGQIEKEVVWTKNKHIAHLLKQFIVHDMYLLDISQNFPEQLRYFYGSGMKNLKSKILSNDTEFNIH